jgi:hypothetical protein
VTGRDPLDVPADMGGKATLLGALVGRGPASRRASAVTQFKLLGERFRERLYLLGANTIVLRFLSTLSQAEEAWKQLVGGKSGGEAWERIQKDGVDLLEFYLGGPGSLARGIAETMNVLARRSKLLARTSLRRFDAVEPDEWDVFAKAYVFELSAIMNDLSARDIAMPVVARALLERRQASPVDEAALASLLKTVRDTWHARTPRE